MATVRPFSTPPPANLVKRIALAAVGLAILAIALSSCVTRVDAGHVGIKVKLAGDERGVDKSPTVQGWVFFNPLTEQIILFPTSVQNIVWTKDPHESNARDSSITFSSQEGVNINADVGLSFHIEPSLAPKLYGRFRKSDLMDLANGYVRNAMRESFNMQASQMPVQEIYGAGKGKLVENVAQRMQEQLGKDGFVIDQLTINGALRLPENVANAINRAMEATQQAIQAENRVRQVRAEAEQAVTQAEGQAKAARARAQGEADAKLITAKAEARSNLILKYSMTPSVLQYRALERWNGRLPVMNGGGAMPMLTFDASKLGKGGDDDEKKLLELLGQEEEMERKEAERAKDEKDGKADAAKAPDGAAPPAPAAPAEQPKK
ncbi:prohibitin family protein [Polyangium mundeleinium]|uniref:Prohibitin family protein n=1 Tax=Polyangium mundeleinium TaxID=2995306 RepID=A0ABT5EZT7_9BACT|nr:prohibitin family protein [Polyangium mundeleinium]MDC0747353.1 prohibitin family protein [Polyangium mundeleinium]